MINIDEDEIFAVMMACENLIANINECGCENDFLLATQKTLRNILKNKIYPSIEKYIGE